MTHEQKATPTCENQSVLNKIGTGNTNLKLSELNPYGQTCDPRGIRIKEKIYNRAKCSQPADQTTSRLGILSSVKDAHLARLPTPDAHPQLHL